MEIPKIIHQTWKNRDIPPAWLDSYNTWKSLENQGWTYILWTDEDNRNFIKTYYPWFLEKFDSYKYGIQRADAIRYFLLHKYGGVYCDLDIVPKLEKFLPIFEAYKMHDVAITESNRDNQIMGQTLTNYFMMSKPGATFWEHVWEMLYDPMSVTWWKPIVAFFSHYFYILFTTGPGLISDSVATHERPKEIVIIPAGLISPAMNSDNEQYDTVDPTGVKHIQGRSWYKSGDHVWSAVKPVTRYKNLLVFLLIIVCIVVSVVLWRKYKKCKESKQ